MKNRISRLPALSLAVAALLVTFNAPLSTHFAQGTAFSYQARLNDGANPANGSYDLRFAIYDAVTNGNVVSSVLTNAATPVTNGLFGIMLDFGAGVFTGPPRWLDIAVRTNGGGAFARLMLRQAITTVPYAVQAANATSAATAASANSVAAANVTGTVSFTQLPSTILTNNATGISLSGTFFGNGVGVTNVNLAAANFGGIFTFTWPGNFVIASSPAVGSYPKSVIAADVNGDGKMDLISANYHSNTLAVLTNNSCGGFAIASSPTTGSYPDYLAAADVNGDGKVDLISANSGNDTLTILTNNGSGGFATASSPAVGSSPVSITVADVNGDGKMDLISANYYGNNLTVLTNNGSGRFVTASSLAMGSYNGYPVYPESVVAADVNGDGIVDLVCASYAEGPGVLTVLTNNGCGGFATAASLVMGNSPRSIAAADVNGDGKVDLICVPYFSYVNSLTVLTNNGSGGFAMASYPAVGSYPQAITVADVNGDNKVDLISANGGDNTLTVVTNNGSGGFVTASSSMVGINPVSIAVVDVNGDGKTDLISANAGDNTLTVLFNTPTVHGSFAGDGSGLTSLNANNLASGTVPGGCLAGPYSNFVAFTYSGNYFNGHFNGDGSGLTILNAGNLASGTVPDARLSGNLARRDSTNNFSGSNNFFGPVIATNSANILGGTFTGTLSGNMGSFVASNVYALTLMGSTFQGGSFSGSWVEAGEINGSVISAGSFMGGTFYGNGSGLNSLNASNLVSGTVPDSRLSGNVALLNGSPTFTGNVTAATNLAGARLLAGSGHTLNGSYNSIAGGINSTIETNTSNSTIAGGDGNVIYGGSLDAVIGGGIGNHVTGWYSTIAGGYGCSVNSANFCAVGGGQNNYASGTAATIPGGAYNSASGNCSFAAGFQAKATNQGAFVWADNAGGNFFSTTNNQFSVRASGGTRFFSDSGATVGVQLAAGGNAWSALSDRTFKENFQSVDTRLVLEKVACLPVTEWNLKSQPATIRHLGPMAQDFRAAFGLGEDDRHISTSDIDGVALAAIQGLNQKVEEARAENAALKNELAELKALVERLATSQTK